MSNTIELDDTPAIIRFLDRFLQEKNIKWLLVLGALIMISSSFMLVARYWDNGFFSAPLKVLVILAYTALIEKTGWWAQKRLGLPKTGTAFLALTACLIPLVFFAIQWVYWDGDAVSLQSVGAYIGLLIAATAFASRAATRIFNHFLHNTPPTFSLSYLLLSLSGALMPLVPQRPMAAMIAAALLWTIFFIGSVKISRHTFWLVESHRYPRIFGFFPIGLLGVLFLGLFGFRLGSQIEWEWIGFGLVLTALPVLVTADSVANVFQQRTGNLIRPIPWSIIAPMILGLILCVLGVGLTFTGLMPNSSPLAISPAALIATIVFGIVATRTGRPAFAWAMLVLIAVAYQFLPFFFKQIALEVIQSGASAVHEDKLPTAFYGLTYLPLILVMSVAAPFLDRKGKKVFVRPLQIFSSALAFILLALSCSHPKALFPVAAVMTPLFAMQTRIFRMPVLARGGIASWLLMTIGFLIFAESILQLGVSTSLVTFTLAFSFAVLLWPGLKIDQALARLDGKSHHISRMASLAGCMLLPAIWFLPSVLKAEIVPVVLPLLLMLAHSLYWRHVWVSFYSLMLFYVGGVLLAASFGLKGEGILIACLVSLVLQWLVSYALERNPGSLITRAFGRANRNFTQTFLPVAALLVVLPLVCFEILFSSHWDMEWLLISLAITACIFDVARRNESKSALYLGTVLIFLIAASMLDPRSLKWIGVVWVVMMLGGARFLQRLDRHSNSPTPQYFQDRLDPWFIRFLKLAIIPGLFIFDASILAAGGIATVGLFTVYGDHRRVNSNRVRVFANWQIITAVVVLVSPAYLGSVFAVFARPEQGVLLAYALGAVISLGYWQYRLYSRGRGEDSVAHRFMLGIVGLGALYFAMQIPPSGWFAKIAMVAALLLWVACELYAAYIHQRKTRVWSAQILLGVLGFYCHHNIDLGGQMGLFVLLLVALGQSALGDRLKHVRGYEVFSDSFKLVGAFLTVFLVVVALLKPVGALNTLAMLGVAASYFYRGHKQDKPGLVVLAGLIAYLVTVHWARSLALSDPQVFMIPAGATVLALTRYLQAEIDPKWQNRLYYVGALMILISPVFSILNEESWMPMFSLLLGSVVVILLSIGLRVRALIYTGTAFLLADLLAMVIRSTMANPNLLPLLGVALGIAVLGLAAWSERHRENLMQRMRILSAELQQWA